MLHPHDIHPSPHGIFVGVGTQTTWPGIHAAFESGAFDSQRVIVVRDVFDRNDSRQTLSDVLAFVADDVVAVLRDVVKPNATMRRFVNEYTKNGNGYKLVRNDVNLISYLHGAGMRVIPTDSKEQIERLRDGFDPIPKQQSTNHVMACAPTAFDFNQSAASDNHFMCMQDSDLLKQPHLLRRRVLDEFAGLHQMLVDKSSVGACVHLFTHEDWHNTPDACFPNNTFSTHNNLETGNECVLVLYPMKDETRRKERRLVQQLLRRGRYTHVYDLTREEERERPRFLEGTGSMVLDRVNRIAYVARSQRSDEGLARAWGRVMDYEIIAFDAVDRSGLPVYHTNVVMSVGTRLAVVCLECIPDKKERDMVRQRLRSTGHEIVDISLGQVEKFCGNVLELENFYGEQVLVMSTAAHEAFEEGQREAMLGGVEKLVHADIGTIERVGGGGVRCTIAELH